MTTMGSDANNLLVCGARAEKAPKPPDFSDGSNKPSILKALEAVVVAGRRGLLGAAAMAAVEAMPDLDLEFSDREAFQETPSPILEEMKEGKKKENSGNKTSLSKHIVPANMGMGVGNRQSKKDVWICGSSVISTSWRRAKKSAAGSQLGFPTSDVFLYWRGIPELKWDGLLPFLHQTYHSRISPSVLVIHLGENDLLADDSSSLVTRMQNDLDICKRAFPDAVIIWSSLLPRHFWTLSESPLVMETRRHEVNGKMEKYCNDTGIGCLAHTMIVAENQSLFNSDNSLSNAAADIFIADVKLALKPHLEG